MRNSFSAVLLLLFATRAFAAPYAYIANNGSYGSVSIVDLGTQTTVTTIVGGVAPFGVSVSPSGAFAYVTNEIDNTVSVIDTSINQVTATIRVGLFPVGVCTSPDGSRAYVANSDSDSVSIIDTSSNTVIAEIAQAGASPQGIAVNNAGTLLYTANYSGNNVSVIDTKSETIVAKIAVGSQPRGIAISPDGAFAYVANYGFFGSSSISIVDTSTNTVVATLPASYSPIGVAFTPDGKFAYIANSDFGTVSVIDTSSLLTSNTIRVGDSPVGVSFNSDGSFAYVTNSFGNTVSVIDTKLGAVTATIPVGMNPLSLGNFVTPPPSVIVSQNIDPTTVIPIRAAQSITYDISAANTGGPDLNHSFYEVVPKNTTFTSITGATTNCTTGAAAGTLCTITLSSTLAALNGSATATITFTTLPTPLPQSATNIVNQITNDMSTLPAGANCTAGSGSAPGICSSPLVTCLPATDCISSVAAPAPLVYVPLQAARLLDTRLGATTIDGVAAGIGALAPGSILNVSVLNRAGLPSDGVKAIVVNVTATNPTANGYIAAWPAGAVQPNASSLNFSPSKTVPNLVIVSPGNNGAISLFNSAGKTDLVADVVGYFTDASQIHSIVPARVLDTRAGYATIDGLFAGSGALGAGGLVTLQINGRDQSSINDVGTAILNVTAVTPTAAGYLTAWPDGSAQPFISSLNFAPNQTVANLTLSEVGTSGAISMFNSAGQTDYVADVVGWFPPNSELTSVTPARLLDTRRDGNTIDSNFTGEGPLTAGASLTLKIMERGNVPLWANSVVVNVTVTNPTAAGFLTVWPSDATRPYASNLNFESGQTASNLVISKISADGNISLFNSAGSTDIVVDVLGWF